jgi:hypothetical protein
MDDAAIDTKLNYFCPICGYEGDDLVCPVCKEKMESVDKELEKIEKKEQDDDLFGEDNLSLEEEADQEIGIVENADETTEDL